MTFAEIIKNERAKYNLSRKYFGKKVGVAQSTLSDWENGARLPTAHSVMKISGRLGWPHDQTLDLIFELENIEEVTERKRSPEEVECQRRQRVELMRRMDEKTDVPGKSTGNWHLLPDDDEDLLALRELMGGK